MPHSYQSASAGVNIVSSPALQLSSGMVMTRKRPSSKYLMPSYYTSAGSNCTPQCGAELQFDDGLRVGRQETPVQTLE